MSDSTRSDDSSLSSADQRREKVRGFEDPNTDRSAELLRLALPMISRHGRGFAPISYSVWYEYVRGENRALRTEVDTLLQNQSRLTSEVTFDVYRRHVVGQYEEAVLQGRANLLGVLDNIHDSVEHTAESTGSFDGRLAGLMADLDNGIDTQVLKSQLDSFRGDLSEVTTSMRSLNERLQESRDEVERLADELVKAREEAQLDPLTGLFNRRMFDHQLHAAVASVQAGESTALTLLMVDIDHFKKVNDEHGHLFGDKVIQGIGRILSEGVMRKDAVCRYGGEEFALILPQTDEEGGTAVAERIRKTVSRSRIRRANSDKVLTNISVSIGVAQLKAGEAAEELVERADRALYQAKANGRNQTQIAD
ncbi:MAG: GGDEF domain-containing protein [Burkholderiaceae bacterium]